MSEGGSSSTQALRTVLVVYGGLFVVLIVIFGVLRTRFPRLYNPRNTFEYLNCELASRRLGLFSWIPGVMKMKDEEIFEQCGMDAICFVRMLRFGLKVSLVACFNATWLIPVYRTSPEDSSTANVKDGLDKLSIANVNEGSERLAATVLACYVLFGCTMILLKWEFHWYISERHVLMAKTTPENYTVLISGIPPALRSKTALGNYLRSVFQDTVLQIEFALHISDLERLVSKRKNLLDKLDHAKAFLGLKGRRPVHLNRYAQRVDSITVFSQHDVKLAKHINARVAEICREFAAHEEKVQARLLDPWRCAREGADDFENDQFAPAPPPALRDAAFVSFTSLQAAANARQILHHRAPFRLIASEAPSPEDVWWSNVGLSHRRVQITTILAGGLTATVCILWTVPVGVIATFTQVESLKLRLPFLADLSREWPLIDDLLALVSPVALITLVSLLPLILRQFAQLEGHVSEDALQKSLFSKFATFMIIQVFLVSSIAGSIYEQIDLLISQPTMLATILGQSLPGQAVTFMAFTFVKSTLNLTIELLRIVPALLAFLRSLFADNLTEKERDTPWLGLAPLSRPGSLDLSLPLAHTILMYVVLFVYAVLAPVSSFVLLFGFFCWEIVYKNQFAFVYNPAKDTGGKIWHVFVGYIVICMLIGQVTVLGVIGLKQGASAAPFLFPLIAGTVLFWRYLSQQHFRVAETLPMRDAYIADRGAQRRGIAFDFVLGKYRQTEFEAVAHPELDKSDDGEGHPVQPPANLSQSVAAVDGEAPGKAGRRSEDGGGRRELASEELHSCASDQTPPLTPQPLLPPPPEPEDVALPPAPAPPLLAGQEREQSLEGARREGEEGEGEEGERQSPTLLETSQVYLLGGGDSDAGWRTEPRPGVGIGEDDFTYSPVEGVLGEEAETPRVATAAAARMMPAGHGLWASDVEHSHAPGPIAMEAQNGTALAAALHDSFAVGQRPAGEGGSRAGAPSYRVVLLEPVRAATPAQQTRDKDDDDDDTVEARPARDAGEPTGDSGAYLV